MNRRARSSHVLLGVWIMTVLAGAIWLAGCIIPVRSYPTAGSRGNVSEEITARLKVGATTKEEVFLLLGEPDFVTEDGRRLGYAWTRVKAWLLLGGYGYGKIEEIVRSYFLRLTFDADDLLAHMEVIKQWGPEVAPKKINPVPSAGCPALGVGNEGQLQFLDFRRSLGGEGEEHLHAAFFTLQGESGAQLVLRCDLAH